MNIVPLLQQLLVLLGFSIPEAELDTGEPGPGTREAIGESQGLLGLERTGEPDEETARAIMTLGAQHLLTLIGLDIDEDEQWRARQGDSTAAALREYQAAHALEVTGQLDVDTLLDLQDRAGNPNFLVSGRVSDSQGRGITACLVTAADLDRDSGARRPLGDPSRPNEDSQYLIEYTVRQIRELGKLRPDLVITGRADDGALQGELGPIERPRVHETQDLVLQAAALPPEKDALWVVRGTVLDDGGPVSGVTVLALDRDLSPDPQPLGEASTGRDGGFRIEYDADRFLAGEGERPPRQPAPDLLFKVTRGGGEVPPAAVVRLLPSGDSTIAGGDLLAGFRARDDEEVRIEIATAAPYEETDEYTALWRAILPLLPEVPPVDADDAERERLVCAAAAQFDEEARRDVTFVSREIDWPEQLVERLGHACRLSTSVFDGEVTPAELYGLAASGFPDVRSLATASLVEIDSGLRRAAAGGVIPGVDSARSALVAELVRRRAPRALLEPPVGDAKPYLAQSLELAGLDPDGQAQVLRLAADFEGPTPEFWKALADHPELNQHAGKIAYTMQLGALTGQNASLVAGLQATFPQATSLRGLTLQADDAQMTQAVAAAGMTIPTDLPGADDDARRALFGKSLLGVLRAADPTASIAKVAQTLSEEGGVSATAGGFLTRIATRPDFDLLTSRVDDYRQDFEGDADQLDTAVNDVKRMQRLARVSTSETNFAGLLQMNVRGASDIPAMFTRGGFVAANAETLASEEEADLTYRRAAAVSAAALTAAVQAYQVTRDVQPYAMRADLTDPAAQPAQTSEAVANWARLFGSVELCECEQCRSWYGAAAYLVDLLLFLEKRNRPDGPVPLDVLLARRPDLAHLKLSCENTNTMLPLIDLGNEVLESYAVLRNKYGTQFTGHDVVDATPEELRASPRHVEQQAYADLAAAVYPVTLPFERWLEVVRAVLAKLGAPRAAVMAAFEPTAPAASADPAAQQAAHLRRCESLGISPRERELITGLLPDGTPSPVGTAELYGFPAGTTAAEVAANVATAAALRERLSLSFAELVDLVGGGFTNPGLQPDTAGSIIFSGTEGDPARMSLAHKDGTPLDQVELLRLNVFVRLWRKLGWSAAELDTALRAFGCTDTITPAALDRLAGLAALRERWDASPASLLGLWGELDTWGKDAAYRRLFEDRSGGFAPDDDLKLIFDGERPTNAEKKLGAKQVSVARALRLPPGDLPDLMAAAGLTPSDRTTVPNLSRLVRTAALAQWLGLSGPQGYADLARLLELAHVDPVAGPEETMTLADLVERLASAELNVGHLGYLLGDEAVPPGAPDDPVLDALGGTIASGLAEMRAGHSAPSGDALTADVLRDQLVLVVDPDTASFVAGLVAGSVDEPSQERRDAMQARLAQAPDLVADRPLFDAAAVAALLPEWKQLHDGDEEQMNERQARLGAASAAVLLVVQDRLGRAIVRAAVRETFELDEALAGLLLEDPKTLHTAAGTALMDDLLRLANGEEARPALRMVHRTSLLAKTLQLSAAELGYIARHAERFDNIDLSQPAPGAEGEGVQRWQRLATYADLRDRLVRGNVTLLDVFTAANAERVALLAAATTWEPKAVEDALAAMGLTPADLVDERAIARLAPLLELANATGVASSVLKEWAVQPPDRDQAEAAVAAARTRFGDAGWLEASQAIHDPLRERQRDALVAHVLTFAEIKAQHITTLDELYEHFLIDVGTSACALTTRVVQANAAVQLFVQRVFLGLENRQDVPDVVRLSPDTVDSEEWEWRRNYRIWEANRRIFLYPENYLLPELRDDRSPFFKDLQSELGSSNLSAEEVERGVLNYLGKLEEASRLEIVGAYRESEASPPRDVLHVFGRTMSGVPRSYYYRRLEDKEWTAWEPVTVDIQGVERDDDTDVSGVHLLPVKWRGKLYLFWPQFTTKQDNEAPKEVTGKPLKVGSELSVKRPEPYWEIRLAWSRLEDGRWTPKQQSDVYFKLPQQVPPRKKSAAKAVPTKALGWAAEFNPQFAEEALARITTAVLPELQLQTRVDAGGRLTISILDRREGQGAIGGVSFADPYAPPVGGGARDRTPLVDLRIDRGRYQGQGGTRRLEVTYPTAGVKKVHLLESTGRYVVTPLSQHDTPPLDAPFFYTDAARAYFVQLWPNTESDYPRLSDPPEKFDLGLFAFVEGSGASLLPVGPPIPKWEMMVRPATQLASASPWLSASVQLAPASISRAVDGAIAVATGHAGPTSVATTATNGRFTATDAVIGKLDSAVRAHAWAGFGFASKQRQSVQVRFHTFFHPHVATFAERLRRGGLTALLSLDTQRLSDKGFESYRPVTSRMRGPLPKHDVDFDPHGSYALYNWEIFYHIPFHVADELRKAGHNRRALDAIRYIFDPLDSTPGAGPQRFWRVLPLQSPNEPVVALFEALEPGDGEGKAAKREAVLDQLGRIAAHPFQPFRIARLRQSAFQKAAVMLFCDICIDAGDALFRQDTRESVGEAMQYYVMVAKVLGTRPEMVRRTNKVQAQSFAQLRPRLTEIGNAFVDAENEPLFAGIGLAGDGQGGATALLGTARTAYFCIPQNEKLLGYWDTVQDRLFKLRNCMNIDGVVRQLDLFAPRIDPLLLARAAAAGIDLGSVLAGLNAPLPHYRFHTLLRTALDLAAETKSLGAALLSAVEKGEAEHLALMRGNHELALLTVVEQARRWQVSEAKASLKTLEATRAKAQHELEHQGRLLGLPVSQIPAPPGIPADPPETLADVKPVAELMTNPGRFELVSGGSIMLSGTAVAAVGGAVGSFAGPVGSLVGAAIGGLVGDLEMVDFDTGTKILRFEQDEIWQSYLAAAYSMASTSLHALSSVLAIFPQAEISLKPLGMGGGISFGGKQLRAGSEIGAGIMQALSAWSAFNAGVKEKQGRFVWRHQDLMLRFNSAILEIAQIDRQIIGAQIRVKIAENDLQAHQKQVEQRTAEVTYQRETKFTSEQTYQLIERSLDTLLKDAYKMAHDLAKQAERAYCMQLGDATASFIKPSYWDGRRRGLLAGEQLYLDLKRMEKSFLQGDRREYEISKQVSLLQIDPAALIDLRTKGACEFELPEWLFNLDFPGHYFRRIKSVGVSLPCIVGPYASVNGTLTLLSSSVRVKPAGDGEDAFWVDPVPMQSIATSTAQNDSGLFELNLRDERFLPFEGAGLVSEWRFTLPKEFRTFDYETIADLVLHVRYTAREGGRKLAEAQTTKAKKAIADATQNGPLAQLFSVRHEFPSEWHRLINTPGDAPRTEKLSIPLARFPLMFAGKKLTIEHIQLTTVAHGDLNVQPKLRTPDRKTVAFPPVGEGEGGVLHWTAETVDGDEALPQVAADVAKADWELGLTGPLQDLEDVLLVFSYTVS